MHASCTWKKIKKKNPTGFSRHRNKYIWGGSRTSQGFDPLTSQKASFWYNFMASIFDVSINVFLKRLWRRSMLILKAILGEKTQFLVKNFLKSNKNSHFDLFITLAFSDLSSQFQLLTQK